MAMYQEDTTIRCKCGCHLFSEVNLFMIEKKESKSLINENISYEKTYVKKGLMCSNCKEVIENPIK